MARRLPWFALIVTILIWAGYLIAVRAAAASPLTPNDVGILRSVPAGVLLLPLIFKRGILPGGASLTDALIIGLMGGFLFTFLLGTGAHFAPVADNAVFTPSMLPVFVMLLMWVFLKQAASRAQMLALCIIVSGALLVGGPEVLANAANGAWKGHILFLAASFSWACYTVRFRVSGISAIDATAILAVWSGALFLVIALLNGSGIPDTSFSLLWVQIVIGLSAGLIANFTFLYSVKHLGPAIPAAAAALVPVAAALGAWVFLDEPINALKGVGIVIVAVGVALASGAFDRKFLRKHRPDHG